MFSFFKRMKTIVSSELNAMLDRAEDPVKMLEQFMREMDADIQEVEAAVAKQIANEKLLKRKKDDAEAMVEKRQQQAEKAVEANEESLARRTIKDKKQYEKQVVLLNESWERAHHDSESLKSKLSDMKKEYQQMKLKKDTLKARAEAAQTKTKLNRAMSSLGDDNSKRGFERMEEKVLAYEAEADTSEELSVDSETLDDELAKLDDDEIDQELEQIKKKLGK
ncbi:MAG TPA: PspA/IM30 family protein [Bacillota bacterium]|nr:PspA/IM30 family protein [Bacillota bacterium]